MESSTADVVVIGAGLTGLSLAYHLNKCGKRIFVVEKAAKPGGVIGTVSEDGFVYESGPNTGVLSTPEIAALFRDISDNCTLETANPKAEKRYILKNGKWRALPSGPVTAVTTPLFSLTDKFRILGEPFRKPGDDPDESVAQLVRRRMGVSFLEFAVDPFISGVYAGDPEKLITRYALPKLYNLEHNYGSFIKGSIKKSREPKTEDEKLVTRKVFSVKGGLQNLIDALVSKVGAEKIITSAGDAVIKPEDSGFSVTYTDNAGTNIQIKAPVVVTTTCSKSLPSLLPFLSNEDLKPLTNLTYAAVVQVALGYKQWTGPKPDAFGGLVPTKEKRDILGVLFPSAIFEGRAPEEGTLLSVFLGGIRKPGMINKSDSEIESIVMKEINSIMSDRNKPDLIRIHRYAHAIPQYEITSGERFSQIKKIETQYKGLVLAGNMRDGIGMADRVKQARQVADLIISNEK